MAAATTRPEKVIGWHWSSPAQVMAMAEIVVAPGTSEETRDAVVELARLCGKNPVVVRDNPDTWGHVGRSEEHTSELQSLMRISYAVFCLKKKTKLKTNKTRKSNNKTK